MLEGLKLSLELGFRNIWREKKRSLIIFSSAAVGMLGILVTMGFINGFLDNIFGTGIKAGLGHIQVRKADYRDKRESGMMLDNPYGIMLELNRMNWDTQAEYSLRFEREGIIKMGSKMQGVSVIGIDPETEVKISNYHQWLIEGSFFKTLSEKDKSYPIIPCVIGAANAKKLELGTGDSLILYIGDEKGESKAVKARITGIFKAPSEPIDKYTVLVKRTDLSLLYNNKADNASYAAFLSKNEDQIPLLKKDLTFQLKNLNVDVLTYRELEPAIANFIDIFKGNAFLLYLFLMIGFGLTLFDTVLMSVLERGYEIGVMQAIGSKSSLLFLMILFESLFLTLLGISIGIGSAYLLIEYYHIHGVSLSFFSKGMELVGKAGSTIYPALAADNVFQAVALALCASLIAGLYPALKAMRMLPANALKEKN